MNLFHRLQNQWVRTVVRAEGDIQIGFEEGSWLCVYNNATLSGPASEDLGAIKRKRLVGANHSKDRITLRFEGGSVIEVDLRDEAYNGPEAMTLTVPGEPMAVWN